MDLPDNKTTLSKVISIGFFLSLLGNVANILQIVESNLIKSIPVIFISILINLFLLGLLIILYIKTKSDFEEFDKSKSEFDDFKNQKAEFEKFKKSEAEYKEKFENAEKLCNQLNGQIYELNKQNEELNQNIEKLSEENDLNVALWQYFIDKIRSITLKRELSEKDALEPFLDMLLKKLPGGGSHYNITVAKLTPERRFKIIAKKHFKDQSAKSIEQKAGWDGDTPLLFYSKIIVDEGKFKKYPSDEDKAKIQRPVGIKPSSSHFLIALKNDSYLENLFPLKTLCVVSIGIPQEFDFEDEHSRLFYDNIYPTIKSIESVLLNISLILDSNKPYKNENFNRR